MCDYVFEKGSIPCNECGFPTEDVHSFSLSVRKLPSVFDPIQKPSAFFFASTEQSELNYNDEPNLFHNQLNVVVHGIPPVDGGNKIRNLSLEEFIEQFENVIVPSTMSNPQYVLKTYEFFVRYGILVKGFLDNKFSVKSVPHENLPSELQTIHMQHLYKPNCYLVPSVNHVNPMKNKRNIMVFKSNKVVFKGKNNPLTANLR